MQRGFLRFGNRFQVQVHLLCIPLVLASLWGKYFTLFAISWGSALLHECCHILAGKRLGIRVRGIDLLPFGVCAPLAHPVIKEPIFEILMALSGPACNFLLAGICYLGAMYLPNESLSYTAMLNLSMGCLNLLPCLPLDGGRVLRCFLTMATDAFFAYRITLFVSRILAILLFGLGVVLLLTSAFQFSLLLIGIFLLGNLLSEQKTMSLQMLREFLYYQKKPDIDSMNRTLVLTAHESLPARKLLRKLSYHRYILVKVLDDRNSVIQTLTESQILTALFTKGIRITLGEI